MKAHYWTTYTASAEFGIDRRTLDRRLKQSNIVAKAEGYTTRQICQAIFGDLAGEKLRNERAEADLREAKLAIIRRDWVKLSDVERVWSGYMITCRQIISNSSIPDEIKTDLTNNLAAITPEQYFAATANVAEEAIEDEK